MANDYWNKGRQEGIQQSSGLETLERLLGIGSNIAGRVQEGRDRRNQALQSNMIDSLYDRGVELAPNYLRTLKSNDVKAIREEFKKNFENKAKHGCLESLEIYKDFMSKMETAETDVIEYNSRRAYFMGTGDPEYKSAEDTFADGFEELLEPGLSTQDKKEKLQGLEKELYNYGKQKMEFMTKFNNRLKNDSILIKNLSTTEHWVNMLLNEFAGPSDGGPPLIDPKRVNLLANAIRYNDDSQYTLYDKQLLDVEREDLNAINKGIIANDAIIREFNHEKTLTGYEGRPEAEAMAEGQADKAKGQNEVFFDQYIALNIKGDRHPYDKRGQEGDTVGIVEDRLFNALNDGVSTDDLKDIINKSTLQDNQKQELKEKHKNFLK